MRKVSSAAKTVQVQLPEALPKEDIASHNGEKRWMEVTDTGSREMTAGGGGGEPTPSTVGHPLPCPCLVLPQELGGDTRGLDEKTHAPHSPEGLSGSR